MIHENEKLLVVGKHLCHKSMMVYRIQASTQIVSIFFYFSINQIKIIFKNRQ